MIPVTDIAEAPGVWAPLEFGWIYLDSEHPRFAASKWQALTPELELYVKEQGEDIVEFLASANTFALVEGLPIAGIVIVSDEKQVTYWFEQTFASSFKDLDLGE